MRKLHRLFTYLLQIIHTHWKKTLFVLIFFIALARLGLLIYTYEVNIYYSDLWFINEAFIHNPTILSLITQQYTAILQGPSFIVSYGIALLSNFDARAENWHTLVYLILSSYMTLKIIQKQKMFSLFDSIVPIAFFTILDYEILIMDTSAPYVFPLFILMSYCYINLHKWNIYRFLWNIVLSATLLFSGYGYTAIPAIYIYLFCEFIKNQHVYIKRYVAVILLWLVGMTMLYIHLYGRSGANDTTRLFPPSTITEYLAYVIHFFGYYFLTTPTIPFLVPDIIISLIVFGIMAYTTYLLTQKKESTIFISFLCMSYTFLYIFANTLGRINRGLGNAEASRYTLHFIPLLIGVYLLLKRIKLTPLKNLCCLLLLAFLLFHETKPPPSVMENLSNFKTTKERLRVCIQSGLAIDICEINAGSSILADGQISDYPLVVYFLNYLKDRKGNLYAK